MILIYEWYTNATNKNANSFVSFVRIRILVSQLSHSHEHLFEAFRGVGAGDFLLLLFLLFVRED